jgi:TonB family protein
MVSFLGHTLLVLLTLGPAHAEEEAKDKGVQSMLDALPSIAAPKAKEEDKPKPKTTLDFNGYNLACSKVVMAYFKAPKGAVKANPQIELELLVQVGLDGQVLGVGAGLRSGDKNFDKAAIKAINKAADLPTPPQGWSVDKDRVLLKFKAR